MTYLPLGSVDLSASKRRVVAPAVYEPQTQCATAGLPSLPSHRIIVSAILHEDVQGIRVSPSVYTTLEELDRFCEAMEYAVRHGVPGSEGAG